MLKKERRKRFTSAIRSRFSLLRFFIAGVILATGLLSILFLHGTVRNVEEALHTHSSRTDALQELHSVSLRIRGLALRALDASSASQSAAYISEMQQSNEEARALLFAFALGSESKSFIDLNGGKFFEVWQKSGYAQRFFLRDNAPQQLKVYANRVGDQLDSFVQSVQERSGVKAVGEEASTTIPTPTADEMQDLSTRTIEVPSETPVATFDVNAPDFTEVFEALSALDAYEVSEVASVMQQVSQGSQTRLLLIALITLLGTVTTLFVGMVFSRRTVLEPLKELNQTAKQIVKGDLSKRAVVRTRDEIGELAASLNILAQRLQTSYQDMEETTREKTDELQHVLSALEAKNDDLEKSQMATINLLEDLEEEKQIVEERVKVRTAELESERNKLLQVTSNMRGGGILLNTEYEVVFANEETYSLLQIPKDILYDGILGHFFAHFEGDDIKKYFKRCIDGETFHVSEISGHDRVYEIFFHHLVNDTQTTGYFVLFFDITDAKLLERSKSELVAVASHQLRTPLTAMRGNVEMLIDESFGALNKEQHELLDDIEVSTIRLITMVNEMLDITKIERGNLEMNIEDLNVQEAVRSVMGDLEAYAARHEFEIKQTISPDIVVLGDRVRIRQIFQNLIDNAIKYSSHPGKLEISAKLNDGFVEIAFADNGIGVPKNEQSKLFERFYRASNTAKTASSGSGLGLYIVKSIARQLGGDIRFESEEGKGTTFFVTLPVAHNNT